MPYVVTFPDGKKATYPTFVALRRAFGLKSQYRGRDEDTYDLMIAHPINPESSIHAKYKSLIPCRFVTWDWKEIPDFEQVNTACAELFNGSTIPPYMQITQRADGDYYTLVITRSVCSPEVAQALWDDEMAARTVALHGGADDIDDE